MTDSPGQRCVREWFALHGGAAEGVSVLVDARELPTLAADIDAAIEARTELMEAEARHAALVLVRRERGAALREAADAFADQSSNFVRVNEGRRLTPAQYHCAGIWRDASNRLRARAAEEEVKDA